MLFKQAFHQGLIRGSTTLTFRRWARPRVKVGGRYRLTATHGLAVDSIERVEARTITDAQARHSGFPDRTSLLASLAKRERTPLRNSDRIFRIAFHLVPLPDERQRLALDAKLSAADTEALAIRLRRMDKASKHGPWAKETLALIAERPRVAASRLAQQLARETQPFKADVRKLKKLGLTLSFDVGYEVSPRGRAFLSRIGN